MVAKADDAMPMHYTQFLHANRMYNGGGDNKWNR